MKQIVSNYSYSPATNVVTLSGVNIDADQLLLIVAPQVGRTLYNFASVTGTVSAGADTRVSLNASTAGLTTTSPLVIFYDDQGSTQTVAGTVTAHLGVNTSEGQFIAQDGGGILQAGVGISYRTDITDNGVPYLVSESQPFPVRVWGGTVTIGSLPAISGTVTANGGDGTFLVGGLRSGSKTALSLDVGTGYLQTKVESMPAISGTVTIGVVSQGAFGATINGYSTDTGGQLFQNCVPVKLFHGSDARLGAVTVGNSVTIGSLPSGALTTRFGSVTTANTSQLTSCVTNASRKYLLAQNISAGTVTIGIGFSPTTTQGIQLTAGAGLTFDSFCPTGAVYWLGAVTGAAYTILEG